MPKEDIETYMFAPCGMNCMVCYKHCASNRPCAGCLNSDAGKPEHCRRCLIKDCVKDRGFSYCFECGNYPCKQMKTLEKSYNTRYHTSLMDNSRIVEKKGLVEFMKLQKDKFTCPNCGGILSLHDAKCSECEFIVE